MRRIAIGVLLVAVAVGLALAPTVPVAALEVGDKAPDFTLPATTQEKLSLSEYHGKKNVLLFGFVGAFTPT
jgi:peroxiredoxin